MGRPGTEVGETAIAAHLPMLSRRFVVKHRRWPLASRPGERDMTLLLLEESVHPLQAHIYVLRSSKGIGHTGWESRQVSVGCWLQLRAAR